MGPDLVGLLSLGINSPWEGRSFQSARPRDDKDQIRKLENVVTTLCLFAKSQRDSDDSAAIAFKIICSLPFGIWFEHQGLLQEVPHPSLGLPSHPLESFPSLPVPCITRCSVP